MHVVGYKRYHEFAACIAGVDDSIVFVPTASTVSGGGARDEADRQCFVSSGGAVTSVASVPVTHCRHSYGVALRLRGGVKVVLRCTDPSHDFA